MSSTAYFTQDFIQFFEELEKNNHREWFQANKKRYENHVKKPFEAFVGEMINRIQEHDAELTVEAKDCILRINRDIRFAKDKTPYNLHRTAFISSGGRKNKSIPGFFLRLSPKMVGIMCGCFGPDKAQLQHIRQVIADNPKAFQKIVGDSNFVEKFGTIQGEQNKRISPEFKELAETVPILANKQFYVVAELPASHIISADLPNIMMEHYHAAKPLNEYLHQAIMPTL